MRSDILARGQPRDQGAHRVSGPKLVRAPCQHEAHPHLEPGAHERGQERARGRVRLVQVLEHQQQRPFLGEPLDQTEQRLHHPAAQLVRGIEAGWPQVDVDGRHTRHEVG